MKTISIILLVICGSLGLFQVENGTLSPSQYTDEITNFTAHLIEHEVVPTIIELASAVK